MAERCDPLADATGVGVVPAEAADEDDSVRASWNMTCFLVGRSVGSIGGLTSRSTLVRLGEAGSTSSLSGGLAADDDGRGSSTSMSSRSKSGGGGEGRGCGGSWDGTSSLRVGVGMYSSSASSGRSSKSASACDGVILERLRAGGEGERTSADSTDDWRYSSRERAVDRFETWWAS